LQRYAVQNGRANMRFAPDALRALNTHPWPGNVRELQNRIKRAVIMADGRKITKADLELTAGAERVTTLKEAREAVEKELVEQTLRKHLGRISSAAVELGISRPTLYELMEKFGIPKKSVASTGDADTAENV
jgi:two-component system NtrC family response regulator